MTAFKFTVRIAVAAIWLFLAYVVIDHIGQQIEFYRAMGGVMK